MRLGLALAAGIALLGLAGCGSTEPAAIGLGVSVGAIPVFHRSVFDILYSTVTGKDCSIVRLDNGQSYCSPTDPPPMPPEYCTRSLGTVDCWTAATQDSLGRPVADGPATLTPAQEQSRTARWPPL